MSPATTSKRKLSTAEERRETLLDAAIPVFAERGFHAASTLEIAKRAGISQAYVFRLYPTKVDLFVAAYNLGSERMRAAFREAAAEARRTGGPVLEVMGHAYGELLEQDRDGLLIQLHAQVAAGSEPAIRDAVRRCYGTLYDQVGRETGASPAELRAWFAEGMLCNAMAAIDADRLDDAWARALTGDDGARS